MSPRSRPKAAGWPAIPTRRSSWSNTASLTCPACARFSVDGSAPLREKYVDTGRVSYELRSVPLHGAVDLILTRLLECAPKEVAHPLAEQIWGNLDAVTGPLYANQANVEQAMSLPENQRLVAFAERAGLIDFVRARGISADLAQQCLSDFAAIQALAERLDAQNTKDNISGTPTFFLNGTPRRRRSTGPTSNRPCSAPAQGSRRAAMLIRKLKLSGFKSFVEPAELRIEPGLTGVVGPNGCGKSNLLEAIRWVMGENSPKSMRSGGMDDVIFAGTAQRPPRDFAEVVLHGGRRRQRRARESSAGSSAAAGSGLSRQRARRARQGRGAGVRRRAPPARIAPALVSQGKIAAGDRRQAGRAAHDARRSRGHLRPPRPPPRRRRQAPADRGQPRAARGSDGRARRADRLAAAPGQAGRALQGAVGQDLASRKRGCSMRGGAKRPLTAEKRARRSRRRGRAWSPTAQAAVVEAAQGASRARRTSSPSRATNSPIGATTLARTVTAWRRCRGQLEAAEQRLADLDRQRARLEADRGRGRPADRGRRRGAGAARSRTRKRALPRWPSRKRDGPNWRLQGERPDHCSRAAELALAKATADHGGSKPNGSNT